MCLATEQPPPPWAALIMCPLLFALVPTAAADMEEWVHDPSQLVLVEGRLFGYGSGTEGRPLTAYEVVLDEALVERYPASFEAFNGGSQAQDWRPQGELDAPALARDGETLLYTWFDEDDQGQMLDVIGVAQNLGDLDEPQWVNQGILVRSFGEEDGQARTMDPSLIADPQSGTHLLFGSHAGGVFITPLNTQTWALAESPNSHDTAIRPERFIHLAQYHNEAGEVSIEAPYLYRQGDFYYLFTNRGACCRGLDSSYRIYMGRSRHLFGPYRDRQGLDMARGGGTLLLGSEGRYLGPGHAGIVEHPEWGQLFSYHFYDAQDHGIAKLAVRRMSWDAQGWPQLGQQLIERWHMD